MQCSGSTKGVNRPHAGDMRLFLCLSLVACTRALCGAPADPGCATCCRPGTEGVCHMHTSSPGSTGLMYNVWSRDLGGCAPSCPPCAACFNSEARHYARAVGQASAGGCECETEEDAVDPCFSPYSCACACQTARMLAPRCGGQ